jgi:hypothetical protein
MLGVLVPFALSAMVAGCGWRDAGQPRDGLSADTARFTYGDRSVEVPLTACGREGDVVVLAGRSGAVVLQAQANLGDGGFDRTGVTADLGAEGIVGAFGAGMSHGPAGEITDVRVEGDRLIVEATWVPLDDELRPTSAPPSGGSDGRLVARCPDDEGDVAGPPARG